MVYNITGVMEMMCENIFCIYWNDNNCILENISLDIQGKCNECIYVNISDDKLLKYRYKYNFLKNKKQS